MVNVETSPVGAGSVAVADDDADDAQRGDAGRPAAIAFGVFVAFAVPFVLLGVGSFHWFFRDDWFFLAGRGVGSLEDLFRPHNSHWSTVPILAFRGLYNLFGLHSYVPYQATVLALHLGVATLLRVIMRRAGVRPWLATAGAAAFVLFGPGSQNILWGFQIGFTGSLFFALGQLVLLDHDGPVDRRDALGVGAGVLSLMSAGVGVAMAFVTGLAALGRRGWRVAALHTAPLGALYVAYWLAEEPSTTSAFGAPTLDKILSWIRSGEIGTFLAIGRFQVVAAALAVVLVVGAVLAFRRAGADERRRLAVPAALLVGTAVFGGLTAWGRWVYGDEFARSSRYLHIGAALTLPALAVAGEAVSRRWRAALPVVLALFVLPIPFNAGRFEYDAFGPEYMTSRKDIITNVVRLPEARQVPPDVRPIADVFASEAFNIGFLLGAVEDGKLDPPSDPMTPRFENGLRLRLGVAQRFGFVPTTCELVDAPFDVTPAVGTHYQVNEDLEFRILVNGEPRSPTIRFRRSEGETLTVELPDLPLRITPASGARQFRLCTG